MRLVLDQGLPRSAARILSAAGIDTVHVGDIGMAAAADTTILAYAEAEQRVVVTLDADFHALLALAGAPGPSVVRLRVEGMRGAEIAELVRTILAMSGDQLSAGAVITSDGTRARVRRLPLVR